MDLLWPWLTLAGLGALHGASPANGWMFAAARGVQARDGAQARRALLPIAIGHAASIAIVVAAVALGILMDRSRVQVVAGALLIGVAAWRCLRREGARVEARMGDVGIALWSCLMTTADGAGLMLVPALVPLCMAATPAREITASGSVSLALLAVGVHLAAMLATAGVIATGVCRGLARLAGADAGGASLRTARRARLRNAVGRHAWTIALFVTGLLLMTLR